MIGQLRHHLLRLSTEMDQMQREMEELQRTLNGHLWMPDDGFLRAYA